MIDYKEVRIGNLVMYKGKEYKIAGITKGFPVIDTFDFYFKDIEWHDLDGVKIKDVYFKPDYIFHIDGAVMRLEKVYDYDSTQPTSANNCNAVVWYGLEVEEMIPLCYIAHFHDLQNLFFTLTNKELPL